jgi:hypothetical protein
VALPHGQGSMLLVDDPDHSHDRLEPHGSGRSPSLFETILSQPWMARDLCRALGVACAMAIGRSNAASKKRHRHGSADHGPRGPQLVCAAPGAILYLD